MCGVPSLLAGTVAPSSSAFSLRQRVQVIVAKGSTIISGRRISSSDGGSGSAASWLLTHFLIKICAIKRASSNRTKLF